MKILTYTILFLIIGITVSLPSVFVQAQTTGENIILQSPATGNQTYVARESIRLNAGFSYKSPGNSFVTKIDRLLVLPPTGNEYADLNGNITSAVNGAVVGNFSGALDVDPTGAATYAVPIECPSGVNGMQPSISLVYNSQGGNGIAGWGFNIGGLSAITRVPKTIYSDGAANGIKNTVEDVYALDGNRLVSVGNSVYYTETETFSEITAQGSSGGNGPEWFKVQAKDGTIYKYGSTVHGRLPYSVTGKSSVQAWMLDYVENTNEQTIAYEYAHSDLYSYLTKITYGNNTNNTIEFVYTDNRFDPIPTHFDQKTGKIDKRLKQIITKTSGQIYRQYDLEYEEDMFSRLKKITVKNGSGEFLHPIVFEWGSYPATFPTSMTVSNHNDILLPPDIKANDIKERFVAALDLDGDGLTDLVNIYSLNGAGGAKMDFVKATKDANGVLSFARYYSNSNSIAVPTGFEFELLKKYIFSQKGKFGQHVGGLLTGDLFGIGVPQIIFPCYQYQPNKEHWIYFEHLSTERTGTFGRKLQSQELPAIAVADLDNNGKSEIIYIEKEKINGSYCITILEVTDNSSAATRNTIAIDLSSKPERIFVADFNSDGMQDIMVVTASNYTLFWNQGGSLLSSTLFSNNNKTTGNEFNSNYSHIAMGDFNGDGLLDFIVNEPNNANWHIVSNKGDKTFHKALSTHLTNLNILKEANNDKDRCFVVDFNQDGKSDLIISDVTSALNHRVFWLRSTGDGFDQVKSVVYSVDDAFMQNFAIGDFNGIGRQDLITYGFNCWNQDPTTAWRRYSNNDFTEQSGKITSITDGMKNKTAILYAPLTDNIHTSPENFASYSPGPVIDIRMPLPAVKAVTANVGTDLANTTNYKYRGAKLHLEGKGFLGFEAITAENSFLNWKTTTTYKQEAKPGNTTYYFPYLSEQNVSTVNGTAISETKINTYGYKTVANSKRVFQYVAKQTVTDKLTGLTVVTETSGYDDYGNPGSIKTTRGNLTETQTFSQYVNGGSWCVNKPGKIEVTRAITGNTQTRVSTFEYYDNTTGNLKGNLKKETTDPSDPNQVVTEYEYNSSGQISKVKVTAKNGNANATRTSETTYTPSGRFVQSKKNALGETTTYDWDETKGQLNFVSDYQGRKTNYQYDNWGRLKLTTYPDGSRTAQTLQWATGNLSDKPAGAKYYSYTETSGESPLWVWYDNCGLKIRRNSYGLNKKMIYMDTEYDEKGRVSKVFEPYFSNEQPTNSVTYKYDRLGRDSLVITPMGTTKYTYNGLINTVVSPSHTVETTSNSAGWVTSEKTNGKTVNFEHYANGQVKKATPQGGTAVEMKYDLQGNRTELKDPSAGTIQSEYDGWGQLKWQEQLIHANTTTPIRTNYNYNATGLPSTKVRNGTTTTYSYDSRNRLSSQSISGPAAPHSQGFTYDAYDRIIQTTDNSDNKTLTHKTEYDVFGRVLKETYPSGYFIVNEYDSYGYLTKVTDSNNNHIWEAKESNARGQLTKTQIGNKEKTYGFDTRGFPTSVICSGIMNLTYTFDSKGNLTYKTDLLTGNQEKFTYDSMDRLEESETLKHHSWGWSTESLTRIAYDETTGDIVEKSDFPSYMNYGENGQPAHALTSAPYYSYYHANLANTQNIDYTDFKKAASIWEGDYTQAYSYGVDEQRVWGHFLRSTTATGDLTRRYSGNYEEENDHISTNFRKIHYISGGNGLAAIFIDNSSKPDTLYYAHTDYQGSLVALSLPNGTVRERYAYDAWGKRVNPNNWSQNYARKSFIIHRGYTMHEHLPEFNLINMNGRMYDPLTGMFLSPDPYIQAPGSWLNHNRYSYCLNNPTKYIDPTGEFWFIIAGALLGAYIGGATAEGNFNPLKWNWDKDTWVGMGIGAGVGALGGWGFEAAAPALAKAAISAFPTFSTTSLTISSYALAGAAAGGAIGFGAGFGSALYSSNGDLDYALKMGGMMFGVGTQIGSVAGTLLGGWEAYQEQLQNIKALEMKVDNAIEMARREYNQQKTGSLSVDFYIGTSLTTTSEVLYSRDLGTWMGKNGKFYDQSWGGNQYTGGKYKFAENLAKPFKYGSNALGWYSIGSSVVNGFQGDISPAVATGDVIFGGAAIYSGLYGGWANAWYNLGKEYGPMTQYLRRQEERRRNKSILFSY